MERGDSRTQAPSAPDDWHEALIAELEEASSDATAHDDGATSSAPPLEEEMPSSSPPASQAADVARYLPTSVRRGVWRRDGGRCTFRDARGVRCRATRALEFHHEQPFARGGPPCMDNITVRCRAHNELAAQHDFGRELVRSLKHRCNSNRT